VKVTIIVTDDSGNTWQTELPLLKVAPPARLSSSKGPAVKVNRANEKTSKGQGPGETKLSLDLSLPIRPFMKRFARAATGQQKFALLVAHMTGGDSNKKVESSKISTQWNKMSGLLGGKFNPAFSTRAKDSGWVDSPKFGEYQLLPGWKGVLSDGDSNN
jgi:hypothetical protein